MSSFRSRIYIIDDDEIILWMFKELLRDLDADLCVFSSAIEFLDAYSPLPSECLICDLRMPEIGGLQVQQRLLQAGRHLPIIFVSAHSDVRSAVEAMKQGAFDFLEKPVNSNLLIEKVQSALMHSRSMHAQHLADSTRQARLSLLTPREVQIVELLVAGKSSSQIAEELDLSARTVENHRARLKEKLHISSTVELIKLFL
ncbi:response regulator transcription factor [Vogesella sp. LIG4]|uniref:response regulator transcription factor n=1 Tax=Vogesella sp. LIG4 TaxID=1192162 RepID=UPI00081FE8B6|nr:response regulator [Vogesella sp. LIG4]SCK29413.1 two component transcriptional regulator, LuxR family [Vogesella sp. LIG4]